MEASNIRSGQKRLTRISSKRFIVAASEDSAGGVNPTPLLESEFPCISTILIQPCLADLKLLLCCTRHVVDGWIVGPLGEMGLQIPGTPPQSQRACLADFRLLSVLSCPLADGPVN